MKQPSADAVCACGHAFDAHEHYRRGTDCALCGALTCSSFRLAAMQREPTPLPAQPAPLPAQPTFVPAPAQPVAAPPLVAPVAIGDDAAVALAPAPIVETPLPPKAPLL